jgi:hypothetical protein
MLARVSRNRLIALMRPLPYYERFGEGGTPLVLLHGGDYGYLLMSNISRSLSSEVYSMGEVLPIPRY